MDNHSLKYAWAWGLGRFYCRMQGIEFGQDLRVYGLPIIVRYPQARIVLGDHVVLNSNPRVNLAGISSRLTLVADSAKSEILIGDHTGMSGGVIYASQSVRIGQHVDIGVNTLIYDTDFHPLDWQSRRKDDGTQVNTAAVIIEDDVWIGANCVVLKGVHIGKRAVIAAGSVVNRNIPENSVWGGNPAKFIKYL